MNTYSRQDQTEVRLSVRDLLSIFGVAATIVTAMWGFSSEIKTALTTYGLRLVHLEKRVEGLELKTVRESAPEYRELMQRWMGAQPSPQAQLPRPAAGGE